MSGKLLVFEGIDGSGKTTQINLLCKQLKQKGVDFELISFPQYGKNKFAAKISDYLSGKLGKLSTINPQTIAQFYAEDRKTVRDLIEGWLKVGKLVIANRYISSSKAHLGANITDEQRRDFIGWVDDLEYGENNMPKEDLTILLDVDPKVGQKLSFKKNHSDLHEGDLKHLQRARRIFLELSHKNKNWMVVDCMKDGRMRRPEDIHQEIKGLWTK